jgi:hypothetical protein
MRHVSLRERTVEHTARKAIDLHDDEAPPHPLGPATVTESPDQTIERALQEEK